MCDRATLIDISSTMPLALTSSTCEAISSYDVRITSASIEKKDGSMKKLYPYLEGQGDLVSRLIVGICRVAIWLIGIINLLTRSL